MSQKRMIVVGAGNLGRRLAQALATSGFEVLVIDESEELNKQALQQIEHSIDGEIARWGLTTGDKRAILSRLQFSTKLSEAPDGGAVFEAISENLELKIGLFKQLDRICPTDMPLITNTAAFSVTEIATALQHPQRVIGMHFTPPVHKTALVEIIRARQTSHEMLQFALRLAEAMGKTPIMTADYPGHITTRIILPMINEAVRVLEEGIATCEQIDSAMKLGFGFNFGPLTLADKIGLDTIIVWMEQLVRETGEAAYIPAKFLRRMTRAGFFGRKSSRGFYRYTNEGVRIENSGISLCEFEPQGK